MTEPTPKSHRWTLFWTFIAFWLPPLVARFRLSMVQGLALEPVIDLRGVTADALLSGVLAIAFAALAGRSRWLVFPAVLLWALLQHANAEHVLTNGAELDYRYAEYAATSSFFFGSVVAAALSVWTLAVLVPGLIAAGVTLRSEPSRRAWPAGLPVLLVGLLFMWPTNWQRQGWRQSNVVNVNLSTALSSRADKPVDHGAARPPEVARALTADLSGELVVPQATGPRNIVVVLLEAHTGGYLDSSAEFHDVQSIVKTPYMNALGEDNVRYHTLIHQQRQSNRGNYAMFCGDYPALDSASPKAIALGQGAERRCLPSILAERGYHTSFMHPGNLRFMGFDTFAEQAGFDEILAVQDYSRGQPHNAWGPDDKTFISESGDRLIEYHQSGQPFFAVLFSTGTHHPYAVPEDYKPDDDPRARAYAFADDAVRDLMERLEAEGVLDDTLVFLTSDEAGGIEYPDDAVRERISRNWAPMVMVTPEKANLDITEAHLSSDMSLTILDYLDLADTAPHFVGRSLLRSYADSTWLAFSNTFLRVSYLLSPDAELLECDMVGENCTLSAIEPGKPFGPKRDPLPIEQARKDLLFAFFDATSRVGGNERPTHFDFREHDMYHLSKARGRSMLFGGQYLDFEPGKDIILNLGLKSKYGRGIYTMRVATSDGNLYQMSSVSLGKGDTDHFQMRIHPPEGEGLRRLVWNVYGRPRTSGGWDMWVTEATMDVVDAADAPGDGLIQTDWQPTPDGWTSPVEAPLVEASCEDKVCFRAWSTDLVDPPRRLLAEVDVHSKSLGPLRIVARQGPKEKAGKDVRLLPDGRAKFYMVVSAQEGELRFEVMPGRKHEPELKGDVVIERVRFLRPD
ncbi:MAG: LTA synthase family protein [Proteobacteria bacterium]|nr:LTA synthase family protein [Pseudomonadota bacterium]